jgi:hypothetical protein
VNGASIAPLRAAALAAWCVAAAVFAAPAFADQPLNPKDALAPIYRDNPKQSNPAAELARLRNQGIAHYEGGLTLDKAIAAFEEAYDLGRRPVDAFNMALVYLKQNKVTDARIWVQKSLEDNEDFAAGQYIMGLIEKLDGHADAARARWGRVDQLHPTDATLHYQLAMLANADNDEHGFLQELLRALELDPEHKSSLYQMYRYYQSNGNKEMAAATLRRFNTVKSTEKFTRKEKPLDDSSFYRPLREDPQHDGTGFAFMDSALSVEATRVKLDCRLTRLAPLTVVAAPAHEELLGACADGALLRIAGDKATSLGKLDFTPEDILVDWFDKQGPRIIAAGSAGVRISGPIDQTPLAFEALDDKPTRRLLLADLDHDGDLDLLTDASPLPFVNSEGKFKAQQPATAAQDAPFSGGGLQVADLRRRGMADFVAAAGANVEILPDSAAGRHNRLRRRIADSGTVGDIRVADLDNDGALDLVAATDAGLVIVWKAEELLGASGSDAIIPENPTRLSVTGRPPFRLAVVDVNNDGRRDIAVVDADGEASVYLNAGPRKFEKRELGKAPAPAGDLIALDENRDGLVDIAYPDTEGELAVLRNTSSDTGRSFDVLLNGRRSPPTGHLTQVELRKGPLYSYAQSSGGLVHFGLGADTYAEILRLEWPNGFVENKIKVDAQKDPYVYEESERIAGSCPTIFVRSGEGFRYVTDALITTALGILQQPGRYFGFGDREHEVIEAGLLTERDGRLDIRLTEELRETTYIDRAALLAVDHPAGARLATTERLAPPAPEKAPWRLAQRLVPAAHASFEGGDVTELLARRDQRYADTVHRTRNPGFARPSSIELTLGEEVDPAKVDAVYATGWFLAFDSTAVVGAFQGATPDFQWPELQERVGGEWRRVGFIGIPTGQNKTAVLTLPTQLHSRDLRILSNFSVYWDEIAFSVEGEAPARVTELSLATADLRFHGFSHIVSREPEIYDYESVDYGMIWSPTPGRFTNYGPVERLVATKDGRYAVMGGGDELALSFAAPAEPPPPGWERSYVLVLDGHVKDADRYTAMSDAVEPLPRLGMTEYPGNPASEDPVSRRSRQRIGLDYTLSSLPRPKDIPSGAIQ